MRNTKCEQCGGQFPINDTFTVSGRIMCVACANQTVENQKNIPPEQIRRQIDPTICVNCETDNGQTDLPTMAGCPVCPKCETFFRNRPFPPLIKAAFVGMVILVAASLVWNMRFIQAYYELRVSVKAARAGNVEKAAALTSSAADRVPESTQLRAIASFYKAVFLLKQNKSAEALDLLTSCRSSIPAESGIDDLIILAEMGVAFDKGDYDKLLELALKINPGHPAYGGSVASAYACEYAATGNEEFRQKSLDALDKARTASKNDKTFSEYENRILHRLETREIISREEFEKKFPDGWKPQQKE